MEKIFSIVSDTSMKQSDFNVVNEFLQNTNGTVKLITPISQHGEGSYRRYGVIIVVSDNKSPY